MVLKLRPGFFVFFFLLLSAPCALAMNCRVAGGGSGQPVQADLTALGTVITTGVDATGVCASGGCNYDGQGGATPTVGDMALLQQVFLTGSDTAGLCGVSGLFRLYGELLLDPNTPRGVISATRAARAASSAPSLQAQAEALAAQARELALSLSTPFVSQPLPLPDWPATLPLDAYCDAAEVWPGELILRLKPGTLAAPVLELAQGLGFSVFPSQLPERFLLKLPQAGTVSPLVSSALGAQLKQTAAAACRALLALPGVAYAHPNGVRYARAAPTDSLYAAQQWNMAMIRLPQARSVTLGGVNVAVVDTGIFSAQSEFSGRLLAGYDFVTDPTIAEDGSGRDSNPEDTSAGLRTSDFSHGTHVTGILGAATDNGAGVAGICPRCDILPLRVLGGASLTLGSVDDEVAAIRWGAGLSVSGMTVNPNPARVLNLSLGGEDSCYPDEQAAINELTAAGAVLLAAAGNSATSAELDAPAKCQNVLAVGAVNNQKQRAAYSNRHLLGGWGFVAPGGSSNDIISTTDQTPFTGGMNGTSQATAHVSGVVALMKTVNPNLTTSQVFDLLRQTSEDLGAAGADNDYGYGLVDAYKAVMAAKGLSPASPAPVADKSALDFGADTTSLVSLVQHIHQDDFTFSTPTATTQSGGNWLSAAAVKSNVLVDGQSVPTLQLTATVNRQAMTTGSHTATVSLVTSVGTVTWAVSASKSGAWRVRALDTGGGTLATAAVSQPGYGFAVGGLPVGAAIKLIAEEDADSDGAYCETGEYCGYYGSGGFVGSFSSATALTGSADTSQGGLMITVRR